MIQYIKKELAKIEEIQVGIIFRSRAIGNHKKWSDVDIAIKGKDIDSKTIYMLNDLLNEEYPLPYFLDLINYDDISNQKLKGHIDTKGKAIYDASIPASVKSQNY